MSTNAEHMNLCLTELARAVRHKYLVHSDSYGIDASVVEIHLQRILLTPGGYSNGGYRGVGLPLFDVEVKIMDTACNTYRHFHEVRATSRAALRAELKQMFPGAKVGR